MLDVEPSTPTPIAVTPPPRPPLTACPPSQNLMSLLFRVMTDPSSTDEEYLLSSDNAISAIFSLLLLCRPALKGPTVRNGISGLLSYLPLVTDLIEAIDVHAKLVDEIAKAGEGLFSNQDHFNQAIAVLPKLLVSSYGDNDEKLEIIGDASRAKAIALLQQVPQKLLNKSLNGLTPDQKQEVLAQLQQA